MTSSQPQKGEVENMEVEELKIPKEQAEAELKALKEAIDRRDQLKREKIRRELMAVDKHLRHYSR
jgi:hypothetical protein